MPNGPRLESGNRASSSGVALGPEPGFAAGYEAIFAKRSLFKAPQPGMGLRLLVEGFRAEDFLEGDRRAYFFIRTDGEVMNYARHYGEGVLEVEVSKGVYDRRFRQFEQLYQGGPEIEVAIPHAEFEALCNARRILHERH